MGFSHSRKEESSRQLADISIQLFVLGAFIDLAFPAHPLERLALVLQAWVLLA